MKSLKRIATLTMLLSALALSACANICERRENFYANRCIGTSVAWNGDHLCEQNLDRCAKPRLVAFDNYVKCLEGLNECSAAAISQCAQKNPGGINLQCNAVM